LRDIGRLQPGERLLVRGGSGGVGSVAVQFGRDMGAHVTALASASNLEFVRGLGAHQVFDYATTRPAELGAFDVILDTVGSELRAYRALLAPKGRMASIVPDPKHPLASMLYTMLSRIHGGRRVRFFSDKPKTQLLADLAACVDSGAIRPIVDKVYPLSAIADAHAAMQSGGRRGKQIVRVLGEIGDSRNATAATPGRNG
jgi:NADPH:quinone reductase-like Zn-dependent oxidoreductase